MFWVCSNILHNNSKWLTDNCSQPFIRDKTQLLPKPYIFQWQNLRFPYPVVVVFSYLQTVCKHDRGIGLLLSGKHTTNTGNVHISHGTVESRGADVHGYLSNKTHLASIIAPLKTLRPASEHKLNGFFLRHKTVCLYYVYFRSRSWHLKGTAVMGFSLHGLFTSYSWNMKNDNTRLCWRKTDFVEALIHGACWWPVPCVFCLIYARSHMRDK